MSKLLLQNPRLQWFCLIAAFNQELSVREELIRSLDDVTSRLVYDIIVPTEVLIKSTPQGRIKEEKVLYPGYVFLNAHLLADYLNETKEWVLTEEVINLISGAEGIFGFAGSKTTPIPMLRKEVADMLARQKAGQEAVMENLPVNVGDGVKVSEGPFQGSEGIVLELDKVKSKIKVSITVFGRILPVDLDPWQIERN